MTEKEMRELDAWIFKTLFGGMTISKKFENGIGYKLRCNGGEFPNGGGSFGWGWQSDMDSALFLIPHYTTDPADAMMVLEKCANLALDEEEPKSHPWFRIRKFRDDYGIDCHPISVEAKTLPLAICLFAKRLFEKK